MFTLSIVAIIAVMIYGGSGPSFPYSPQIPQFSNPFDERTNTLSNKKYVADANATFGALPQIQETQDCENNTDMVHLCVNSDDENNSYIRFTTITDYKHFYNIGFRSAPNVTNIDHATVSSYTWSISCRTLPISERALEFQLNLYSAGNTLAAIYTGACPYGTIFQKVTGSFNVAGLPDIVPHSQGFIMELWVTNSLGPDGTYRGNGIADVSYFSIEIINDSNSCVVPDGAWFPWADEVACAIGNAANVLWKGLVFVFNGLIYIGEWLIFIGQHISNGLSVVVWLYAIPDVPGYIQAFVDAILSIWLIVIGIEAFKIVKPFGGD